MDQILTILTSFGKFVLPLLPQAYVSKLQATLPAWAIGLLVVVVLAFALKVVTNIIFKVILWFAIVVLLVILLESFNVPILQTITHLGN